MDSIIITAVFVLAVIAIIEAVSLFAGTRRKPCRLAFAAVVPVFPQDNELRFRLAELERRLSDGSFYIEEIILIDYGAGMGQMEICRRFCSEYPNAVMTDPAGLEKILSKTFAINLKI